jgi:tetratricopeptide (TPR) repeat protein
VGFATVWMGARAKTRAVEGGATRPAVERLLTQGLALLQASQEHVHLAKPSIERAQELAREAGSSRLQARAFVLRARLSAIQGRPDRALAFVKRAEALTGPSPVLDRLLGDAYSRVWRWASAAEAYRRVADAAPLDYRAWRDLARAYGSLSDDRSALAAADAGLALAPLDESLLRSRALALEALGDPKARGAKDLWLTHRKPDEQPALLASCERAHQRCRRDRKPIPHYTLIPPTKPIHASGDPG